MTTTPPASGRRERRRSLARAAAAISASVAVALGTAPPAVAQDGDDGQIVGGAEAPPGEWPQVAALLDNGTGDPYWAQYCAGTVLNRSWVLTASHCLYEAVAGGGQRVLHPSEIDVLTGTQDLTSGGQRIPVAELRVHPQFIPATKDRDVAVLRLDDPTTTSRFASLPTPTGLPPPGTSLRALGWGVTSPGSTTRPTTLRQVDVPLRSDAECSALYTRRGTTSSDFHPESMICAGPVTGGKDTCQGDSGGPLFAPAPEPTRWTQVGITSWGYGCADPAYPGVYADLPALVGWVQVQIRFGPHPHAVALVRQLWLDLHGREPTAEEIWRGVVRLGEVSTEAFLAEHLQGRSWQRRAGGVARLYRAALLRDAETEGLAYWIARQAAGWSLRRIADHFARSAEFTGRYGSLDDRGFVEQVYRNVLGREGDTEGIAYWTGQLESGARTRGGVILGISGSAEFAAANRGRVDATISFFALLRRVPVGGEMVAWAPATPTALARHLVGSYAYADRF